MPRHTLTLTYTLADDGTEALDVAHRVEGEVATAKGPHTVSHVEAVELEDAPAVAAGLRSLVDQHREHLEQHLAYHAARLAGALNAEPKPGVQRLTLGRSLTPTAPPAQIRKDS